MGSRSSTLSREPSRVASIHFTTAPEKKKQRAQGKGDGPISGKIPPPPSYVSDRLMQFPPGRIFHVITLGTGKMPSYAAQLSADERWKVVTYVHGVLQGFNDTQQSARKESK